MKANEANDANNANEANELTSFPGPPERSGGSRLQGEHR